ncbi:hypothetical protein E2C01_062717 [Portunus trituberculatus]|uniref:Uncharacterized protein n=1 Tax=Portunus trituberculatus TaxID=210409 RepID=A0A5B7HIT7_PORTR|nr:hypothetical protein [Portunus trituberculatus]
MIRILARFGKWQFGYGSAFLVVLKLAKLAFVTVGYAIVGVVAGSVTSSTSAATNSNGGTEEGSPTQGE